MLVGQFFRTDCPPNNLVIFVRPYDFRDAFCVVGGIFGLTCLLILFFIYFSLQIRWHLSKGRRHVISREIFIELRKELRNFFAMLRCLTG